jgi:hypothetical protein
MVHLSPRFSPITLRAAHPGLVATLASSFAIAAALGGCGSDDDDTTSTAGQGGSSAAKGGAAGGSAKAGRGGASGSAGRSDAGRDNAGEAGDAAGGKGGGGKGGRGGSAGVGGTQAGHGGEPLGGSGGTTAGTSSAGEPGEAGAGAQPGIIIDPDSFDGKEVFRHDTFGDEVFWTGTLRINEAIQAALDPVTALGLGLKVDADALPPGILDTADLTAPATTVALIGLGAVVGVKGHVDSAGNLTSVGITCALCHSSVDNSVMAGIGSRVDGQANHDLDPGAIIALSPGLAGNQAALDVLNSWGPGFYDPRWNQDGINHPVVIPSIYGLAEVPMETYTGDGPVSYWNSYVAVTQMHGQGQFFDPRIDVAVLYTPDLVTPKLPSLFDYEVSLLAPAVPASAFDADAATRGQALFEGSAQCSTCHKGPALTDAGEALHAAAETGMDPITASRSATGRYRTTPLRGLLANGPYFHDGSAATLADVVSHYDTALTLGLTPEQQADLTEYLKSL